MLLALLALLRQADIEGLALDDLQGGASALNSNTNNNKKNNNKYIYIYIYIYVNNNNINTVL